MATAVKTQSKSQQDLLNAVHQLKVVCEEHMLPLQDIGFSGDIGAVSVEGVEIKNRLLSEDNIGEEWQGPNRVRSVGTDEIKTTEIAYNPAPEQRYGDLLMTGQEWLSKALHMIYDHQTDHDYFRSNEKFQESTITMAEVETLLQKAAGITNE